MLGGGNLGGAAVLNTYVHFLSRSQEEMISWMQVSESYRAPGVLTLAYWADREGGAAHMPSCSPLFGSCSVVVWHQTWV